MVIVYRKNVQMREWDGGLGTATICGMSRKGTGLPVCSR